jgi:hypothetical protein
MEIYFRALASENWSKVGNNLVSTSLQTVVAPVKAYCFLNPVTLQTLGGTKDNAISPNVIHSSSMMSNTLHQNLSAEDFSYNSWSARGWDLDSIEIFKSQLKKWLLANFLPFSVLNPDNSINAYVVDKTVSGNRYVVPLIYIGDEGTPIETITANMSIAYPVPLYTDSSFTVSGKVTDNGIAVTDVLVTIEINNQSETVTSDANGDFSANFDEIAREGTYTLTWSANINGSIVTKTRPVVVSKLIADTVNISIAPQIPTNKVQFTATANVVGNNLILSNTPITLTYNGSSISGKTNNQGNFSADFTAESSVTSLTYDALTISGSSNLTFSTLQTVTITTTPSSLIDEQSFVVNATVKNALNNFVPNAATSITYDGVVLSGATNASGVFTSGSFIALYGKNSLSYNVQSVLTGSYTSTVGKTTSRLGFITASVPAPDSVITGGAFTIGVTTYDQYSEIFPNAQLEIKAGDLVLGSGVTDNLGIASIYSTAPNTTGSFDIYAASGSVTSNAQSLTVTLPPPVASYMTISDPDPAELFIGNSFRVTVEVYDQYNNIFLEPTFITITEGSLTLGTGTSSASTGSVTINCSAPIYPGTYQLFAVAGTASSSATLLNVFE